MGAAAVSLPENAFPEFAVKGAFLPPDDIASEKLPRDYELGGVALNDATQGQLVKTWQLRLVGDSLMLSPYPHTEETFVLSAPGITACSLAFDQNMRPTVAYISEGRAYLRWYDSQVQATVTTELDSSIRSLFLTMDDKRDKCENRSDVLLFYTRGSALYYRQQRDRYTVERLLRGITNPDARIVRAGMNDSLRIQVELSNFPS